MKNHESAIISSPAIEHPRSKLAVLVYSTITPERIVPNGDAAEPKDPITEFTLPCRLHACRRIDRGRLKKILARKKHKVIKVISKISIDFLLTDLPRRIRKSIVNNEDGLKSALGTKVITDYRSLSPTAVADTLSQILPRVDKTKIHNYASSIVSESQKCHESLRKLGIDLG